MSVFFFTFILYVIFFSHSSASLSSSLSSVDRISKNETLTDGKTLISNGGIFEFGFFSPGKNSKNHYAGIWYAKIPAPKIIVWVANRCKPVNDSSAGSLSIEDSGNLVVSYRNETVLWSTSLSRRIENPILRLLDSGNLVLRDEKEKKILWQSFDYPSDTLLPGMKLGWDFTANIERRMSTWKSWDDPCNGYLTYGFDKNPNPNGTLTPEMYLINGASQNSKLKIFRSGPWNGVRFSGIPDMTTNNTVYDYRYVFTDKELYYMYTVKFETNYLMSVVLNETTGLRSRYLAWDPKKMEWDRFDWGSREICDFYGFCGANGICVMAGRNHACVCPERGFYARDLGNLTSGCVRKGVSSCEESKGDGFVKLVGLKLPDTADSWVNRDMNLMECRAKCLNNCSCTAYTNSDIRGQGSGCLIWFGDLIDIRKLHENGQDLFVRISASHLGKAHSNHHRAVVIVAVILVAATSGLLLFVLWVLRRKYLRDIRSEKDQEDLELPLFDLATISAATDNFATENKLGEGGFGPVYKGKLKDGKEIAVKRLSTCSGQGSNEFKNEVILIAKLQHRNLVKLLGCCIQGEEKLLIYEFMPNKSLDLFIFDGTKKKLLDWQMRFEIICGIARGILYLHQDSRLRIIHRDLKASNVLLDNEMKPKISDFGMAKSFGGSQTEGNTNRVVGTYGYMAPEYASDGLFSVKSDVFSFGILILEIISGKKNRGFFNPDRDLNLTGHAWELWKEKKTLKIVDEYLVSSCTNSQILRCVHISLLCVQQSPEDRPNMSAVVLMLASDSPLDEPNEPGFFSIRGFDDHVNTSSSNQAPSINEASISSLAPR